MTTLITGGAGFLGQAVCRVLAARGVDDGAAADARARRAWAARVAPHVTGPDGSGRATLT